MKMTGPLDADELLRTADFKALEVCTTPYRREFRRDNDLQHAPLSQEAYFFRPSDIKNCIPCSTPLHLPLSAMSELQDRALVLAVPVAAAVQALDLPADQSTAAYRRC